MNLNRNSLVSDDRLWKAHNAFRYDCSEFSTTSVNHPARSSLEVKGMLLLNSLNVLNSSHMLVSDLSQSSKEQNGEYPLLIFNSSNSWRSFTVTGTGEPIETEGQFIEKNWVKVWGLLWGNVQHWQCWFKVLRDGKKWWEIEKCIKRMWNVVWKYQRSKSVPLCTHTVEACLCVLGAACVREDLGGKGGSRKLLKVILQPAADSSFPPGAS